SRDHDDETNTLVKTHCICILFIPAVALAAYRVAHVQSAWYFLGRVPLSAAAKAWNLLLVAALVATAGVIGCDKYSSTPDYIAGRRLAEGDQLAGAGEIVRAAEVYRDVAVGKTVHAGEAAAKLKGVLDGPAAEVSAQDAAAVLRIVVDLEKQRP